MSAKISVWPVSLTTAVGAWGVVMKAMSESCNPVGFFLRILEEIVGSLRSIIPVSIASLIKAASVVDP